MVSVRHSISDIDPAQWNRLAGSNAFATHGWLSTIEASCRVHVEPLYFTVATDAAIVGAAVAYVCPATRDIETLDDMTFGRFTWAGRALGLTFLPALICGPLLGYGWHIGVADSLSAHGADAVRRALLAAIATEGERRGLPVSFTQILDEERELKMLLAEEGYLPCRNIPMAVLDVQWRSFREYLSAQPGKRRREFQRQINRHVDAGRRLTRLDPRHVDEAEVLALLDGNGRKYNGRPYSCGRGFIRTLARSFGDQLQIFASKTSGAIDAVSVILIQGTAAFTIAVGVKEQLPRAYSYFQVLYNGPIASATELDLDRIYFGRELYELKLRRGCRLMDTWTFVRPTMGQSLSSRAWFAVASYWNHQKLSNEVRQSLNR